MTMMEDNIMSVIGLHFYTITPYYQIVLSYISYIHTVRVKSPESYLSRSAIGLSLKPEIPPFGQNCRWKMLDRGEGDY